MTVRFVTVRTKTAKWVAAAKRNIAKAQTSRIRMKVRRSGHRTSRRR